MLRRTGRGLLLLGVAAVWCGAPAVADDSQAKGEESLDLSKIISSMSGALKIESPGEAGKLPDFEEVTKDMTSDQGLFTLWYYPPEAKDKD